MEQIRVLLIRAPGTIFGAGMDPGDIAYLIFLALFAVANLLRKRKKAAEEEGELPLPELGENPRSERPGSLTPPRRQPAAERQSRSAPRPRQPETETESGDEDPMKRILEDLFGPREAPAERPAAPPTVSRPEPRPAPREKPRPAREKAGKPGKPRIPVAQGYREGESFESYVQRTRQQARDRMAQSHAAQQKEASQRPQRKKIAFDLRQAVINDAVLRRPYT